MATSIELYMTAKDAFSAPVKGMSVVAKGLKKDVNMLQTDLNALGGRKIELKLESQKVQENLKNTKKEAERLGVSFDELFKKNTADKLAIEEQLKSVNKEAKETQKNIDSLNSSVTKLDNNSSARAGSGSAGSSGSANMMLSGGLGAFVGQQVNGLISGITSNILPNSINSALTGAITGGATGFAVGGPVGAAIGATVGGATAYIGAEVQKQTDKAKQRVNFGSNLITQVAPQLFTDALDYSNYMENTKISMETLVGKERAEPFMGEMMDFARKTPFEFKDVASNAKSMMAYNFKTNDIIPMLGNIGDSQSALGNGQAGIDSVVRALGQMKAATKVNAQDMNQLQQAGIRGWDYLAKATRKTVTEVKALSKDGLLPAEESIRAIINGLGDDFGGLSEKLNNTLPGILSNIKDSFGQVFLNPFGTGFKDGIMPALREFADFFGLETKGFANLSEDIKDFGKELGELAGGAVKGLQTSLDELFNNDEFENASLPDKFKLVLDKLKSKADEWLITGGQEMMNNITGFVTDIFIDLASDTGFISAAQNMWLAIVPNEETMNKIMGIVMGSFWTGVRSPEQQKKWDEATSTDTNPFGDTPNNTSNANPFGAPVSPPNPPEPPPSVKSSPSKKAFGQARVPYDNYPTLLHEGETVLTKNQSQQQNSGYNITIAKIADSVVIRSENDIDLLAQAFAQKLKNANKIFGGAY